MTTTTLRKSIDLRTLSEESGIAHSTLRQWISEGRLKAFRVAGTRVRVFLDDFYELFEPIEGQNNIAPKHKQRNRSRCR